jgi:hypothetical protein
VLRIFSPLKILRLRGTKGQHATPRPPKPLTDGYVSVRVQDTHLCLQWHMGRQNVPCSDTFRFRLGPPVVSGRLKRERGFIAKRSDVCCAPLDYNMSESRAECQWPFRLACLSHAFRIHQSCAAFLVVFVRHALWTARCAFGRLLSLMSQSPMFVCI